MPKYVFTDAEPISMELITPGDYVITIMEVTFKIDQKSGKEKVEIKCLVDLKTTDGMKSYVWEHITFTPEMAWKMDSMLQSCNVQIKKGEEYGKRIYQFNGNLH